MQNRKICMASAWLCAGSLQFGKYPLQPYDGLSLFGRFGNGKYLNAAERRRFVEAARRASPKIRYSA